MWVIFAFHLKHFSLNAFKEHFMVINFNISLKHDFVGVVWIMRHIVFETVCHGYNVWLYRLATDINWIKMKIVYLTEEKIIGSCRKIEDLRKKRNQVWCKKRSKNLVTKFRMKRIEKQKKGNEDISFTEFYYNNFEKKLKNEFKTKPNNIFTKKLEIFIEWC